MDSKATWLICAGPDEFLFIATALMAAGCAGAIEWEPSCAKAYGRAARSRAEGRMNAVVGMCEDARPEEAACTIACLVMGKTVLCTGDARSLAELVVPRGVAAAVEPSGLLRTLLHADFGGTSRQDAPGVRRVLSGDAASDDLEEPVSPGSSCGARQGAGDGSSFTAAAFAVGPDMDAPVDPAPMEPAALAGGRLPAAVDSGKTIPLAVPELIAASPALRTHGRLPRTGVSEHPTTARPRDAVEGAPAPQPGHLPGNMQIDGRPDVCEGVREEAAAPAGRMGEGAFPASPARVVAGVETEPISYRPVIALPQLECSVAGEDRDVPTICFASARGGVGKTSLAVLTALTLARDGLTVALVDLDFQFGTCLGYLGADETDGLLDAGALPAQVRVDARMLARCRTTPERCLAAYEFCHAPEQAEVLAGMAGRLLRAARAGADVAVVDLPTGVNDVVAQVLDMADRCLLVADQRAFSLESLTAQRMLCARLGVPRTKLVTVMNRCDARHRDEGFLSRVEFEAQTPQIMRVVDGGSEVMQMLSIGSAGELLSMRNRFALSTADLAHALSADLGCQATEPNAVPRPPLQLPPRAGQQRAGFRLRRKDKRGEQVECPF